MSSALSFSSPLQPPVCLDPQSQPEMTDEDLKNELEQFENGARKAAEIVVQQCLQDLATAPFEGVFYSLTLEALLEQLDLPEKESLSLAHEFVALNSAKNIYQLSIGNLILMRNLHLAEARNRQALPDLFMLRLQIEKYEMTLKADNTMLEEKTALRDRLAVDITNVAKKTTKNNKAQIQQKMEVQSRERSKLNADVAQLTKHMQKLEPKLASLKNDLKVAESANRIAFDSCLKRIDELEPQIEESQKKITRASRRLVEIETHFMQNLKNKKIERSLKTLRDSLAAREARTDKST